MDRERCCRECANWFLGCLNGRERWSDKAVRPNFQNVTLKDGTVDGVCDAFFLDPNPKRKGRVVLGEDEGNVYE